MRNTIEEFLNQVARRGSWFGGGSVAAMSAAMAAALLEKLIVHPRQSYRLRRIRRECIALSGRDAAMFARVIRATHSDNRMAFVRALKLSTEVPWRIFEHSYAIQFMCRRAQRRVKPQLQSDLRCAMALALAASEATRTLVHTNLAWLNDASYARRMKRRLNALTHRRLHQTLERLSI